MKAWVTACAIVLAAALAATAAAAPGARTAKSCTPTESDGFGPFGQGGAAPVRTAFGTGFVLRGRILRSLDCKPLAGAVVEIWQATRGGVYDAKGRASTTTGRSGAFRFTGPAPVAYEGIAPHIHVRVSHPGFDDVATTIRVNRGARSATLEVVLTSTL
jgi:protocatechuate 3,4-dioxygenase beta subunit